jgi:diphosphoinositol-polyphosphate diphosphatase
VPLSTGRDRVLLIQSSRRTGWVLPKGGWETDEATPQDAAKREAWEEAGILTRIEADLGVIADRRPAKDITSSAPKASFRFFQAVVEKEEVEWPEKHKRDRRWMRYAEAKQHLASRPELLEALNRSGILKK